MREKQGGHKGTHSKSTTIHFLKQFKWLEVMRSLTEHNMKRVMDKLHDSGVSNSLENVQTENLIQTLPAALDGHSMKSMTSK